MATKMDNIGVMVNLNLNTSGLNEGLKRSQQQIRRLADDTGAYINKQMTVRGSQYTWNRAKLAERQSGRFTGRIDPNKISAQAAYYGLHSTHAGTQMQLRQQRDMRNQPGWHQEFNPTTFQRMTQGRATNSLQGINFSALLDQYPRSMLIDDGRGRTAAQRHAYSMEEQRQQVGMDKFDKYKKGYNRRLQIANAMRAGGYMNTDEYRSFMQSEYKEQGSLYGQLETEGYDKAATQVRRLSDDTIALTPEITKQEKAVKKASMQYENFAQKAFSLHIATMYLSPAIQRLNTSMRESIDLYGEFEKKYVDYVFKSDEYDTYLGKNDILNLAKGQVYSAHDVQTVAERYAASGLDITENPKAISDALQVATTQGMDYNDATNLLIKSSTAMGLSMNDTTRIVDAQSYAANKSTAEVQNLAKWFRYAASFASQAGVEVEQLSGHLQVLDQMGTPDAGVYYRQMLTQFKRDNIRKDFMSAYNFTEEDFLNVPSILETLRQDVGGHYDENNNWVVDKSKVLEIQQLLGGRVTAQQALGNLISANEKIWNELVHFTPDMAMGYNEKMYEAITDNYIDATQRLKNNIDILKIQMASGLTPAIQTVNEQLTTLTTKMIESDSVLLKWLGVFLYGSGKIAAFGLSIVQAVAGIYAVTAAYVSLNAIKVIHNKEMDKTITKTTLLTGLREKLTWSTVKLTAQEMTNFRGSVKGQGGISKIGLATQTAQGQMIGLVGVTASYSMMNKKISEENIRSARSYAALTSVMVGLTTTFLAFQVARYFGPPGVLAQAGILGLGAIATLGTYKGLNNVIDREERDIVRKRYGESIRDTETYTGDSRDVTVIIESATFTSMDEVINYNAENRI